MIGAFGHAGAFGNEFWTDPQRGLVVLMAQGLDNATTARKTFNAMVNPAYVGP